MHLTLLLQKVFAEALIHIDKRLHRLLLECAATLCEHRNLSIATLGRLVHRAAYVKQNIKIDTISIFLFWIIGLIKKADHCHFIYQANTVKSRNVLSNFIIGW